MIGEPKRSDGESPADLTALLRPQGLSGRLGELTLAFVAVVALVALYLIEVATPKDFSVTALSMFPVLAVAWLCGARVTVAVFLLSAAFHVVLAFENQISFPRMAVHISADATIAILGRLASVSLASVQASREKELGVLLDVARKLSLAGELQDVREQVATATAAFFSERQRTGARATVFRVEDGFATVVAEDDQQGDRLLNTRYALDVASPDLTRLKASVVLEPDHLSSEWADGLGAAGISRVAVAPIRTGEELTGFLAAAIGGESHFSGGDLRVLEGIADLAGIAIASAARLEAERRRVLTFETLHEVATAVAAAAAPQDVAGVVARKAAELVGADTAVLAWQERKGDLLRVLASEPEGIAAALATKDGVVGQAFLEGVPVVAHGDEITAATDRQVAGENDNLLAVPLIVQGDTVGALTVAGAGSFSNDDVMSVAMVASQVAPLINQARLRSGLDESAQRFKDLYHALACGVIVHGAGGEFVDANWAAENLLGVGQDVLSRDAFGAGWSIRLPNGGELLGPLRPPTAVSLYSRPIQGLVAQVTAPGGSPRWLRIDSNPVGAGAGTRWVVTSFFEVPAPAATEQGPIAQLK